MGRTAKLLKASQLGHCRYLSFLHFSLCLPLLEHSFLYPISRSLFRLPLSVSPVYTSPHSNISPSSCFIPSHPPSVSLSFFCFNYSSFQCRSQQGASGPIWICRGNLSNGFSWEYMQSPSFIAFALWGLLSKFVAFERKNWLIVKSREEGNRRKYQASVWDLKNMLAGSEIEGVESLLLPGRLQQPVLSFWKLSFASGHMRRRECKNVGRERRYKRWGSFFWHVLQTCHESLSSHDGYYHLSQPTTACDPLSEKVIVIIHH